MKNATFAERLAAQIEAPAVESHPYGKPAAADCPWSHVSGNRNEADKAHPLDLIEYRPESE